MNEIGIGRRYVCALFELAVEAGDDEARRVGADLDAFEELRQNEELAQALADPRTAPADKKRVLEALLPQSFADLSRDFLLWTTERGRAEVLPFVASEYAALLREREGVGLAEVTSAAALDEASAQELKDKLEKLTGKRIELHVTVDASLLGGVRVRIGSTLYDGTLQRSLEQIRRRWSDVRLPDPEPMAASDS